MTTRARVSLAMAAGWLLAAGGAARAAEVAFGYDDTGDRPALLITPDAPVDELHVELTVGDRTVVVDRGGIAGGSTERVSWEPRPGLDRVDAFVRAVFADGYVGEYRVPIELARSERLSVDLSGASADVEDRVIRVPVTAHVDEAEVVAWGAGRRELDRRTVPIDAGPGTVEVPWVGDPHEVVLLDITLRGGDAWASLSYSPWFLDIPHEDVLFETDQAEIRPEEEWKLERTLEQLHDVVAKYGDLVPVQLYVAGCTDTVGDRAHNRELSERRARAIARWLRAHGFDKPIFYYGFGEDLLAVPTGDGVDEAANRRALYIVAANPPPRGSGIPSVRWRRL